MNFIIRGITNFETGISVKNCYLSIDHIKMYKYNSMEWRIKYIVKFYINKNAFETHKLHFYERELEVEAHSFEIVIEIYHSLKHYYKNVFEDVEDTEATLANPIEINSPINNGLISYELPVIHSKF